MQYEPRYYAERDACRAKWEEVIHRYVRYRWINILLTLPDPGPIELAGAIRVVEEIRTELAEVAREDLEQAALISEEVARTLRVPVRALTLPDTLVRLPQETQR